MLSAASGASRPPRWATRSPIGPTARWRWWRGRDPPDPGRLHRRAARAGEDRAHALLLRGPDPGRDRPGPRRHREPGEPGAHQGGHPAAVRLAGRLPRSDLSAPPSAIDLRRPLPLGIRLRGSFVGCGPPPSEAAVASALAPVRSISVSSPSLAVGVSVVAARSDRRSGRRLAPPAVAVPATRRRARHRPLPPPSCTWCPGNRGIDYATAPGTPVRASAGGVVTFAGRIGADLYVTILHPDGLRTSYAYLASIASGSPPARPSARAPGGGHDRCHLPSSGVRRGAPSTSIPSCCSPGWRLVPGS